MKQEILTQLTQSENPSPDLLQKTLRGVIKAQCEAYRDMGDQCLKEHLISEINYLNRHLLKSCRSCGALIRKGDLCYIDYGRAYLQEAGFQHFGLVVNVYNAKAFVIPMTSNPNACQQAYDPKENPKGLTHLMRIGQPKGMNAESVLFLNDAKFINMARIIDVKGHLDPDSALFQEILTRLVGCIINEH